MVYLLGCLPPGGCHTGALVRALGRHGKLVPLRNADLCSTAALRLIRPKSKQPKRLAPKSFQVQLKVEKMSAFVSLGPYRQVGFSAYGAGLAGIRRAQSDNTGLGQPITG